MKFKINDEVILDPTTFQGGDFEAAPVWGGKHGYIMGNVKKLYTHAHNPADHTVGVTFDNGKLNTFSPSALRHVTPDMRDAAQDARRNISFDNDIWLLLSDGNRFSLSCIEASVDVAGRPNYSLMLNKTESLVLTQNDFNLVNVLAYDRNTDEAHFKTLAEAMTAYHESWGLPPFRALPFPLPEVQSIKEAVSALPTGSKLQLARFTLPRRLTDFVIEDQSSALNLVGA